MYLSIGNIGAVLHETTLPDSISFAHPTAGAPVSLTAVNPSLFRCTFDSDGAVSAGQGEVVLYGGQVYERASVYLAGGVEVDHWDDSGWKAGS